MTEEQLKKVDKDVIVRMKIKDLLLIQILVNTAESFVVSAMTQGIEQMAGRKVVALNGTEVLKEFAQTLQHFQDQGVRQRISNAVHENGMCPDPKCEHNKETYTN